MSDVLNLTVDEVLSTTRAVRKRLDFERPVDPAILRTCLQLAQQAPNGNDQEEWRFVVVTDPELRQAVAEVYREGWANYDGDGHEPQTMSEEDQDRFNRSFASAMYLHDHLHEVPVHVIPCVKRRTDKASIREQSIIWSSILPASWSFMLAARERGLGTCWTVGHLYAEEKVAKLLGIPFESVQQTGLIAVAHSKGTDFKPARRDPVDSVICWDRWRPDA
jgi:nitroreductase